MEIKESLIPVTFTQSALDALKKVLEQNPEACIRVGVKGGGCSGMTYVLGTDIKTETDIFEIINEIPFLIDKRHVMYLVGMEVDYHDGLNARGFEFKNPNAKTTCGCGTSFSV